MSAYFIPMIIIALVVYSIYKRNNAYNSFVVGAKKSFELIYVTFPYIVAILAIVAIYNASGLNMWVAKIFAPILNIFGVPVELTELIILKNFTGGGSIAILENIFTNYGVDTYIGKCASVVMASSEAIFYISAVYFSKTKIEKYKYLIPLCLCINFFSAIVACFVCRFI
ncbi:MAG: hypothetical protein E7361_03195 [Clostridiales bacterium]|nr:hypothetical protein [Clostridiales bacterium]